MAVTEDLEQELAEAYRAGRSPRFLMAGVDAWVKIIDVQLGKGRHELAHYAIRHLRELEPEMEWARSMEEMLTHTAATAPETKGFKDDLEKDVQIVRRRAGSVIVCFCDGAHRMGLPVGVFHRWLAPFPASVIYLRDFEKLLFMRGVASLGPGLDTAIVMLRLMAKDLGAGRILCVGNSGGAYAALRYGLLLGADAVLSMAGPTNMTLAFSTQLNEGGRSKAILKRCPGAELDLRVLYTAAKQRPRTIIAYGAQCWNDRVQAEHMSEVAGVKLVPIPDVQGHGVIRPLIKAGQFGPLLAEFFGS